MKTLKNSKFDENQLISNLVNIEKLSNEFVIEMKYATEDNFTRKKVYPISLCVMQLGTARKLIKANEEFLKMGLRIKIWDAYRPLSVQKLMYDIVPNDDFVANPYNGGSIHNSGFAVDITLVDMNGEEIEMPSGFDDFSEKASRNNTAMNEVAAKNLSILTDVMIKNGFVTIDSEWWHYCDEDFKERIALNIPLEEIKDIID